MERADSAGLGAGGFGGWSERASELGGPGGDGAGTCERPKWSSKRESPGTHEVSLPTKRGDQLKNRGPQLGP